MKAAQLLVYQGLGKPAVTASGKLADDIMVDQLEKRLAALPKDELEAYMKITAKLQTEEVPALPPPA